MSTSPAGPPLDYEPARDRALARRPWWKFRWDRRQLPFLIFMGLMMMIAPLHALYVENLHRQRPAPTPAPPPTASRPSINIHLPPT